MMDTLPVTSSHNMRSHVSVCVTVTRKQKMEEKTIDPALYVEQMALLINLPLDPEHRPGVVENMERIITIAQLVNDFPLPDEIEAAPVFQP